MGLINDIKDLLKPPPFGEPPRAFRYLLVILIPVLIFPFAIVANMRVAKSSKPRISIFQDMGKQPRLNAQDVSSYFEDNRAMRPYIAGTVPYGRLNESDPLHRGLDTEPGVSYVYDRLTGTWTVDGQDNVMDVPYVDGYPDQITVDEAFIRRGQMKFNTMCSSCHGVTGDGNGMVHQRATLLANLGNVQGWVQPVNLHDRDEETGELRYGESYPNGHLYTVITHGARSMWGYGPQLEVEDRWAIVAYVRALQMSQGGVSPADAEVPADQLQSLEEQARKMLAEQEDQ